jgi:hypothetical protein
MAPKIRYQWTVLHLQNWHHTKKNDKSEHNSHCICVPQIQTPSFVFGIGAGQETCTLAKLAFEMWSGINGCSRTVLDGRAVEDACGLEDPSVRGDNPQQTVTCWRGEGCVEPTNFCLWNNEGHSWGNRFPGMSMAREWMEAVFVRAESRTAADVAGSGGERPGRIACPSAFALWGVVLLCATIGAPRLLRMLHCFVGKGRKWKR